MGGDSRWVPWSRIYEWRIALEEGQSPARRGIVRNGACSGFGSQNAACSGHLTSGGHTCDGLELGPKLRKVQWTPRHHLHCRSRWPHNEMQWSSMTIPVLFAWLGGSRQLPWSSFP